MRSGAFRTRTLRQGGLHGSCPARQLRSSLSASNARAPIGASNNWLLCGAIRIWSEAPFESGRRGRDSAERGRQGSWVFFDENRRLAALSEKGDPLGTVAALVPWESFRADIEAVALTPEEAKRSKAGRKPFDALVLFRMLVLQALYNLSDGQIEHQVRDRLSNRAGYRAVLAPEPPPQPVVRRPWRHRQRLLRLLGRARRRARLHPNHRNPPLSRGQCLTLLVLQHLRQAGLFVVCRIPDKAQYWNDRAISSTSANKQEKRCKGDRRAARVDKLLDARVTIRRSRQITLSASNRERSGPARGVAYRKAQGGCYDTSDRVRSNWASVGGSACWRGFRL